MTLKSKWHSYRSSQSPPSKPHPGIAHDGNTVIIAYCTGVQILSATIFPNHVRGGTPTLHIFLIKHT